MRKPGADRTAALRKSDAVRWLATTEPRRLAYISAAKQRGEKKVLEKARAALRRDESSGHDDYLGLVDSNGGRPASSMAGRATSRVVWEKVTVLNGPVPDATDCHITRPLTAATTTLAGPAASAAANGRTLAGLAAPTPVGCGVHYCEIANLGQVSNHAAFGRVFPSAEAAEALATALNELWQVCVDEGHEPLHNTGKVRGGRHEEMVSKHEALARARLGWDGESGSPPPCGAIHGGYTAMGGRAAVQGKRFRDVDGGERQAPYLWKVHQVLDAKAPWLNGVLAALQYAMEYMLLLDNPEVWLSCFELTGDLDAEAPAHGRLFESGLYNQFVVNRNLVLEEHTDHFNHEVFVSSSSARGVAASSGKCS